MLKTEHNPQPADLTPGLRAVVTREYQRIRGRAVYWLLVLVLPLVSFALSWGLFSTPSPQGLPVAVVDLDHSALSRKLTSYIDAASSMAVIVQPSEPVAAKDLMLRGHIYAAIILPQGLERDIKRGLGGNVIGYTNTQMLLPGSIISSSLNAIVATVSAGIVYQSRLRGGEMKVAAQAQLEPILLDRHVLFNPQLNYLYFLGSALCPTFLQLFVIMTVVLAVGEEFKDGTARQWLATAGDSVWRAVFGKLAVYLLSFTIIGMLMNILIIKGFGVPVRGSLPGLVSATILLILAVQACGLILLVITPSLRMALSLASFYAGTAFAFVGLTFPQTGMPSIGRAWSQLLPLTHYLQFFSQQTIRGAGIADAGPVFICLGSFIVAGFLLVSRLKRYMLNSRYWGKL